MHRGAQTTVCILQFGAETAVKVLAGRVFRIRNRLALRGDPDLLRELAHG
jgi:hypothetical protein